MEKNIHKIRVILADDHPLVRTGIRTAMADEPDILLVSEATNGNEVQALCKSHPFDVLVLDLRMPGASARETVAFVKEHRPQSAVIILSAYEDDIYLKTLLALGIKGYVLKDEASETVVTAIRAVARGGSWFSQRVISSLVSASREEESLSLREQEVINLMKEGLTNKEIAVHLSITERTVRYHTENLMKKLRARNRLEAIAKAIKKGWVAP